MSCDKTTHEWHLTPSGWVEGTFSVYGEPHYIIDPPNNRVETWIRDMVQTSSFSREDVSWKCIWESPAYSIEQREALRRSQKWPDHHIKW